jgi:primosomal protein N' (replication factor Y)
VQVPLGSRDVIGVVWDDAPDREIGHNRLRSIVGIFDVPPLTAATRRFVDWVANYTLTSRGMVLRMVLRAAQALEPEQSIMGVRRAGAEPPRMTGARRRVLAAMQGDLAWSRSGLAAAAGVSPSVIDGLVDAATLEIVAIPPQPAVLPPDPDFARPALSAEQQVAADALREAVAAAKFDDGPSRAPAPEPGMARTPGPPPLPLLQWGLSLGGPAVISGEKDKEASSHSDRAARPHRGRPVASADADLLHRERDDRMADRGGFTVTLLDGVTGSGKTEVYFEAAAAALKRDRQVLILLPEIALTASFLDRFVGRFGTRPAEWHSDVAPRQRRRVWRAVAEGTAHVVVGARSALFLPYRCLGLIVVDEEHDLAYKQEDGPTYSARDMAVVRARIGGFPAVLSSATPSIESRVNADAGRYRHVTLSARYQAVPLPAITAVDLREHPPERGRFLSPRLAAAVGETIGDKRQTLLFLNRRGYAPLTLCRTCGHRFQCPNCSTWLVEHRFRGVLLCHHCGHTERRPAECPNCGAADSLTPVGPGIERLAEEVADRFAGARTIVLSSDAMGGVHGLRQDLAAISRGEYDIVIGTQLVAKGHNFPLLALVGVVDADLSLAHGDLRAAERTFQLLVQVTGRAGRSGAAGRALLQTWMPEHPVIQALVSGDGETFYANEIAARRAAGLPPFGRLAALIVSGPDRHETQAFASSLRRTAPHDDAIDVFGPAEAPLALVRGRYRYRLLVHAPRHADVQSYVRAWLAAAPKARSALRIQIDIDPQSFV